MASVKEIRLANLLILIEHVGTVAELARRTDNDPIYLRQLKDRSEDSRTGRPREMGDQTARKIEEGFGMAPGRMDQPLNFPFAVDNPNTGPLKDKLDRLDSEARAQVESLVDYLLGKAA